MEPKKNLLPNEEKPLEEKDFIQEIKGKDPIPLWLFFLIVIAIFTILWAGGTWLYQQRQTKVEENPFLNVTNREMSLFLWQNPEYMRIHNSGKTGYLPGFHASGKVNPMLESVDEIAAAPPEVLFQYHTWKRLLGDYNFPRPIPIAEFKEFLSSSPEWSPENWKQAPTEYTQFIKEIDLMKVADLQTLPPEVLPVAVRQSFLGWKNYYREGDLINKALPKKEEMRAFLEQYPNFARNNWRNIHPEYLKTLESASEDNQALLNEELTSFLRAGFYNYTESLKKSSENF